MSRETPRGKATVRQICTAFGLSRQAYYEALNPRVVELRPRKERRGDRKSTRLNSSHS